MSKKTSSLSGKTIVLLSAVLLLAAAAVTAAKLISDFRLKIEHDSDNVSVFGRANKTVSAEAGFFTVTLSARAQTYAEAYQTLSNNRSQLLKVLESRRIAAGEIEFAPVKVNVNYRLNDQGHLTNQVFERELQQTITVKSAKITELAGTAQAATDLLAQGVELGCGPVEYTFADQEQFSRELLPVALDDAKRQLDLIAGGSRSRIGLYSYISPESLSVVPGGKPGEKTIQLTVYVTATLIKQ